MVNSFFMAELDDQIPLKPPMAGDETVNLGGSVDELTGEDARTNGAGHER
jgi:hypothetical protein